MCNPRLSVVKLFYLEKKALTSTGFTFCERASTDKLIGGFHIPAGTDVTIDWKSINIDSPVWSVPIPTDTGKLQVSGYDFSPARFRELDRVKYRYNLVEYGCGVRRCIGQNFANIMMKLLITEVIAKYRITAPVRPFDLGFRRDKFVLTPKCSEILFEEI